MESQLIKGDCIEVMAGLRAGVADCVFADPPYNLQLERELLRPNTTRVDGVADEWDQFGDGAADGPLDSFEAYDEFTEAWLSAARHVLSDTGTIWVIGSYHNIYRVGRIMMDLGYWVLNDIVWVKTNPMPNFRGVRFTNAHETLLWAKKSKGQRRYTFNHHTMKRYNDGKQMRSDWELPLCTGTERITVNGEKAHTTQKPEALLERVIVAGTRIGDMVLDPFFGTGTTGAVARRLGRRWIGIEKEARYIEVARKRIAAVEPMPDEWLRQYTQDAPPPKRVPFGELVREGYIRPGATLRHVRAAVEATVHADGTISMNGHRGSIHRVGALATGSPACNGWTHWTCRCPLTGREALLDELRQAFRGARGQQEMS
ncbi:MAG TPA: modification methylase [Armatimonadetes bacterium]|nr:modification methylase [Armatimonadota bacterium]